MVANNVAALHGEVAMAPLSQSPSARATLTTSILSAYLETMLRGTLTCGTYQGVYNRRSMYTPEAAEKSS
jgi:hypothetical protein